MTCWRIALENPGGPTALTLSRQHLTVLDGCQEESVRRDGAQKGDPLPLAAPRVRAGDR